VCQGLSWISSIQHESDNIFPHYRTHHLERVTGLKTGKFCPVYEPRGWESPEEEPDPAGVGRNPGLFPKGCHILKDDL
jgi:hypothetical protein